MSRHRWPWVAVAILGFTTYSWSLVWDMVVHDTLVIAYAFGTLTWGLFLGWMIKEVWQHRESHDMRAARKAFERAWKDGDPSRRLTVLRDDGAVEFRQPAVGRDGTGEPAQRPGAHPGPPAAPGE